MFSCRRTIFTTELTKYEDDEIASSVSSSFSSFTSHRSTVDEQYCWNQWHSRDRFSTEQQYQQQHQQSMTTKQSFMTRHLSASESDLSALINGNGTESTLLHDHDLSAAAAAAASINSQPRRIYSSPLPFQKLRACLSTNLKALIDVFVTRKARPSLSRLWTLLQSKPFSTNELCFRQSPGGPSDTWHDPSTTIHSPYSTRSRFARQQMVMPADHPCNRSSTTSDRCLLQCQVMQPIQYRTVHFRRVGRASGWEGVRWFNELCSLDEGWARTTGDNWISNACLLVSCVHVCSSVCMCALFIENRTINGNRPLGPVCSNDESGDDRRSAVTDQSLFWAVEAWSHDSTTVFECSRNGAIVEHDDCDGLAVNLEWNASLVDACLSTLIWLSYEYIVRSSNRSGAYNRVSSRKRRKNRCALVSAVWNCSNHCTSSLVASHQRWMIRKSWRFFISTFCRVLVDNHGHTA